MVNLFLSERPAKRPRAHFFTLSNRIKNSEKRRNTNENQLLRRLENANDLGRFQ